MNVGNLMIEHVIGREISPENTLKVRDHSDAFTNDINYYGKPAGGKKLDT